MRYTIGFKATNKSTGETWSGICRTGVYTAYPYYPYSAKRTNKSEYIVIFNSLEDAEAFVHNQMQDNKEYKKHRNAKGKDVTVEAKLFVVKVDSLNFPYKISQSDYAGLSGIEYKLANNKCEKLKLYNFVIK